MEKLCCTVQLEVPFREAEHFMDFEGTGCFFRFFLHLHGRPECPIDRHNAFIEVGSSRTSKFWKVLLDSMSGHFQASCKLAKLDPTNRFLCFFLPSNDAWEGNFECQKGFIEVGCPRMSKLGRSHRILAL